MWLDAEPNQPLVELHRLLLDAFEDCDDVSRFETGFRPHLSVGQAKTREDVEKLIAEFSAAWETITFTVSAVCLIWRSKQTDDIFKVDRRVKFGGGDEPGAGPAAPSGSEQAP
jgi:hypothetical protein